MGNAKEWIESGKAVLGIELGSTRIKAVLVDGTHKPIASGAHDWENQLVNGIWTYDLDAAWRGLQNCYQNLVKDVQKKYNVTLKRFAAIGISQPNGKCKNGILSCTSQLYLAHNSYIER